MVKLCVKKNAKSLIVVSKCSFLSLLYIHVLWKWQNQKFLGEKWRKHKKLCFFYKTWREYSDVKSLWADIVSRSVAVMYKLSWYVIPLCEPNTGLIDLNMLYFCITVICYLFTFGMIWETSKCVFYKSPIWLRPLPCASFISRASMCLSTWVCAIGSCFWVFVYC